MLKKKLLLIFIIGLSIFSCKKEKNNNQNLFLLFLLGSNQNVNFTGNLGNVNSSYNRNSKALPDGITDVLAISSRNHYNRSKVDSSGNFSLSLVKGYSYIIIFIDSSLNVKGYYQVNSLGLNSIPTQYAGNEINGGSIQKSTDNSSLNGSYIPVNNFNMNEFLTQAGNLSISEIGGISSMSSELLPLLNIDADGNGVIDLEEGLYTRLSFSVQWGIPNIIGTAKNNFVDLGALKTIDPGFYGIFFSIDKTKASDSNIQFYYPVPINCQDNSYKMVSDGLISMDLIENGGVPTGDKFINARSNSIALTFRCNNSNFNIPQKGNYIIKNSGKVYSYNKIEPFIVKKEETILVPNIKFVVENDIVKDVQYKFQKVSQNKVEDATEREVNIVYGKNSGSGIGCSDYIYTGAAGQVATFSCSFNMNKASGSVQNCSNSNTKLPSPINTDFNRYKDCYIFTQDPYGNYIGYTLN